MKQRSFFNRVPLLLLVTSVGQLQFQRENRPRNYLARREQWRLLLIVLGLGIVVAVYLESRDPDNFRWFDGMWQAQNDAADRPADPRREEEAPEQDLPGSFRSPLAEEPASNATTESFEVGPVDLEAVRDDTPFRSAEQDAWFGLFKKLQATPSEALRTASIGRVTYVQLAQQPSAYRGQLVSLAGTVRRAQRVEAPKNDQGIDCYYQLWLQPQDRPTDPIVVYSLYLPEGFPTGTSVSADVRLSGYFFKRWAYMAQDRLRSAPTVLSKSVDWIQRPVAGPVRQAADPSIWVILGISAAIAALAVVYIRLRTQGEKRVLADRIEEPVA